MLNNQISVAESVIAANKACTYDKQGRNFKYYTNWMKRIQRRIYNISDKKDIEEKTIDNKWKRIKEEALNRKKK